MEREKILIKDISSYFATSLRKKLELENVSVKDIIDIQTFEDILIRKWDCFGWYSLVETKSGKEYGISFDVSKLDFINQGFTLSDVDIITNKIQKELQENFGVKNDRARD